MHWGGGADSILVFALQQLLFPSDDDLKIRLPIIRHLPAKIFFEQTKDGSQVVGLHVLRSIDAKPREADAQQVGQIISDARAHAVLASVQVSQTHQPPVVQGKA